MWELFGDIMFDKILIFIVFLGPLVFFHELGHFLFARLFGVRVETFSIGFGPKLFSFKKGDTQYAISLIPLGGYVKMFGDNVLARDEVPMEERSYAYTHKSIWARFWIVFGGPLANFLMAFVIFWGLFLVGEVSPKAQVGNIQQDNPIYKEGLRTSDIIQTLNGKEVETITDLSFWKNDSPNQLQVLRGGKTIKLTSNLHSQEFLKNFAKTISYFLRQPLVVDKKGKFFILSKKSTSVNWNISLEELVKSSDYLWKIPVLEGAVKNEKTNIFENKNVMFNKASKIFLKGDEARHFPILGSLYPADLSAKSLVMDSAADKAGIRAKDIITHIGDKKLSSFIEMRDLIQKQAATGPVIIKLLRNGNPMEVTLNATKDKKDNLYKVGIYRREDFIRPAMVKSSPKGLFESFPLAIERTWNGGVEVVLMFKKLIFGEASMKNLGGPIAIGKFAAASFYTGLTQFLAFMAMMSINLGILNLLPIPVLDGGHIIFLGFELVNRGPLSKKKTEFAYKLGFSLLMMMLAVALFNDISSLFRG